jgi:hypothetical protein
MNEGLFLLIQSIPRIISIPLESRTINLVQNSTPLKIIFTIEHTCLGGISPLGELTTIRHLSMATGILCFSTYAAKINECNAQESNRTIAVVDLTENNIGCLMCLVQCHMVDPTVNKVLLGCHRSWVAILVGDCVGGRRLVEAVKCPLSPQLMQLPSVGFCTGLSMVCCHCTF